VPVAVQRATTLVLLDFWAPCETFGLMLIGVHW
jgi:hypothetical protein